MAGSFQAMPCFFGLLCRNQDMFSVKSANNEHADSVIGQGRNQRLDDPRCIEWKWPHRPQAHPITFGLNGIGNPSLRAHQGQLVIRPNNRLKAGATCPSRDLRVRSQTRNGIAARQRVNSQGMGYLKCPPARLWSKGANGHHDLILQRKQSPGVRAPYSPFFHRGGAHLR